MTQPKLKVGQVGVGGFGNVRRQRMRETGLFDLAASFDLNQEAMAQCQKEDGARPCSSYEELLATPGLEAVVISTGAKFHAVQAIAAMEKGLHVFVEKPLCCTREEIDQLLEAQKKTGRIVGMGHHDHSTEGVSLTTKKMIEAGQLGKIATFEATTAHSGGLILKPGDWRADPEKNPGGMLFQCGVHLIHELIYYFGPVKRVAAMMRSDVHTTATADVALCHLEFHSGVIGSVNAYHVTPYRHTLFLFGTVGNLYREERFYDEGTKLSIQVTKLDGKKEEIVPLPSPTEHEDHGNLRSFYQAVRQGGTPYPSLKDGARVIQTVLAAEESGRKGGIPIEPALI